MSLYSAIASPAASREAGPQPVPFAISPAREPHRYYHPTKRAVDIVLGGVFLVVGLPVLLGTALLIAVTTRSNPFFVQERVGLCGQPFRLVKLKTMVDGAHSTVPRELDETGGPTFKTRHDPRVTPIGRMARKASIDELPQLFNVLSGQMSLVGPRPPLPEEVAHYSRPQLERLTVKPGLTGIWQVSGRSTVPFRTWMAMDRIYVRRRSLARDLGLLALTPWAVVSMRGAF